MKNWHFHFLGGGILILSYIKNILFGYKTPRTFSVYQINRSVDYDFRVAEQWIKYLSAYLKQEDFLKNKVVLELGPGPDLGIGLILLAAGAKKYIALDVNKLATSTPLEIYNKLFERIKKNKYPNCNIDYLEEQLDKCYKREDCAMSYIVDKDFEIAKVKDKIDIVFSQATFEHFANVNKTLRELSNVVKPGGVLVTEIDLKTHSRWIRDRDPLNIYRYSDFFWNLFKFKSSPNRVRSFEYKGILEKNGWFDIEIEPLEILKEKYLHKVKPLLNKKFREIDSSEMGMLSIMLMAKKR